MRRFTKKWIRKELDRIWAEYKKESNKKMNDVATKNFRQTNFEIVRLTRKLHKANR